jgi:hypothetical protein
VSWSIKFIRTLQSRDTARSKARRVLAIFNRFSESTAARSNASGEALGQAMGREVSQLDLRVVLGLNLASVEVGKWEDEGASGPEAVALSYLSQGLPGFRGDLPEWSYQQAFHAKGSAACKF